MGGTMGDTFPMACPCLRIPLENGDLCLKEWPPVEAMSWPTGAVSIRWDYSAQPPAQLRKQSRNSLCTVTHAGHTLHTIAGIAAAAAMWLPSCLRVLPTVTHVVLGSQRPSFRKREFRCSPWPHLAGYCEAGELITLPSAK